MSIKKNLNIEVSDKSKKDKTNKRKNNIASYKIILEKL